MVEEDEKVNKEIVFHHLYYLFDQDFLHDILLKMILLKNVFHIEYKNDFVHYHQRFYYVLYIEV